MLGWLAAHVAMGRLLVHAHADAAGGHYHHADGYLAPAAVLAAAMTVSALLAVRALAPGCAHRRPVSMGSARIGWWAASASTAGFLALEAVDTVLVGRHPGLSGVSFVLAAVVHGTAAVGTAALGRACVRVVVHRIHPPALLAVPVVRFARIPNPGRAPLLVPQCLCAPLGGRAPPVRA